MDGNLSPVAAFNSAVTDTALYRDTYRNAIEPGEISGSLILGVPWVLQTKDPLLISSVRGRLIRLLHWSLRPQSYLRAVHPRRRDRMIQETPGESNIASGRCDRV